MEVIRTAEQQRRADEHYERMVEEYRIYGMAKWKYDQKVAEAEKERARVERKALKLGITTTEVKRIEAEKAKEKANKAKRVRYEKELAELEVRKAYLEKWLKEN